MLLFSTAPNRPVSGWRCFSPNHVLYGIKKSKKKDEISGTKKNRKFSSLEVVNISCRSELVHCLVHCIRVSSCANDAENYATIQLKHKLTQKRSCSLADKVSASRGAFRPITCMYSKATFFTFFKAISSDCVKSLLGSASSTVHIRSRWLADSIISQGTTSGCWYLGYWAWRFMTMQYVTMTDHGSEHRWGELRRKFTLIDKTWKGGSNRKQRSVARPLFAMNEETMPARSRQSKQRKYTSNVLYSERKEGGSETEISHEIGRS